MTKRIANVEVINCGKWTDVALRLFQRIVEERSGMPVENAMAGVAKMVFLITAGIGDGVFSGYGQPLTRQFSIRPENLQRKPTDISTS